MTNQLIETAEKFIETNGIKFKYGKRESFLNDLKRSVQPIPGGYRATSGQKIDLETYMLSMLETSLYSARPSAKQTYAPAFPIRSEATRSANKKLSEAHIRKLLMHENIVLDPQVESKIIETLAENFLVTDDSEKGVAFAKINDTVVGSIPGKDRYSLEELLNTTGASKFIDGEATRLSKLQHKSVLRQKAVSMLEAGAKPKEVEKLVEDLAAYERRDLKTGMKLPYIDRLKVEQEFNKKHELEGGDRSAVIAGTRSELQKIDDVSPLRFAIMKIEVPNNETEYNF